MKRQIIKIDEDKCTGCGLCIPNCHEGALQIIDGKVRLVSDLMCDGLGACIGHCPEDALEIVEREAEPYDEEAVIKGMIPKGKNLIVAHLLHLKDHNEQIFLKEGIDYLKNNRDKYSFSFEEIITEINKSDIMIKQSHNHAHEGGCPGAKSMSFHHESDKIDNVQVGDGRSELRQWPVQLHLLNPNASYFQNADVVLAADCVAFSLGNFHSKYLKGKSLAIACPKLDSEQTIYVEKIKTMFEQAKINTLTVLIMEVPCCGGLLQIAKAALERSSRKVPIKAVVVGIQGEILSENWV